MTNSDRFDWAYYLTTILIMAGGIFMLYLGNRVFMNEMLNNIGIVAMLVSIIAFFARNVFYILEGSDPDNQVIIKNITS